MVGLTLVGSIVNVVLGVSIEYIVGGFCTIGRNLFMDRGCILSARVTQS
jgi:hypothetical protein